MEGGFARGLELAELGLSSGQAVETDGSLAFEHAPAVPKEGPGVLGGLGSAGPGSPGYYGAAVLAGSLAAAVASLSR